MEIVTGFLNEMGTRMRTRMVSRMGIRWDGDRDQDEVEVETGTKTGMGMGAGLRWG